MKQMPLDVAHRRWLVVAMGGTVFAVAAFALGLLGTWEDWILLAIDAPLGAVGWVGWRKTRPVRPRPDYALIAELERTELGIDPRSERRPDCRHEHPHEILRVNGRVDRLCLDCGISLAFKPQPPPGRGAGSPTGRRVERS